MKKEVRIGSVTLDNPLVLAPMAGITNLAFRLAAKKMGAGLVCSEMVSANGLVRQSARTEVLLQTENFERPLSMQIFGSDPYVMAEAAQLVYEAGADIVDINFGCSVKKVIKIGAGAALMRDMDRSRAILQAVREKIQIPLTIKVRSGWDATGSEAEYLCKMAEDCGVDAVAVHPRTAKQGFSGRADRQVIAKIKATLKIPVIGNGDVLTGRDAWAMMEETGCDAVMIGRAAAKNPWIFAQALDVMNGGEERSVSAQERLALMAACLSDTVRLLGEKRAWPMMRSQLSAFSKGLNGAGNFREAVMRAKTITEARAAVTAYVTSFSDTGSQPYP